MVVRCAKCGEELLGAVNRCWRCGTPVVSRPGDALLPPVRRPPINPPPDGPPGAMPPAGNAATEVVVAALVDAPVPGPADATAAACGTADTPVVARRVGSPFAATAAMPATGQAPPPTAFPALPARYPRHSASVGGATAALVLGILSLVASFFTAGALVIAALGLAMGVWGLYSTRRGLAIAGIVLCCIALAMASFTGVVALYEMQHGYKPWATPSAVDSVDDYGLDDVVK